MSENPFAARIESEVLSDRQLKLGEAWKRRRGVSHEALLARGVHIAPELRDEARKKKAEWERALKNVEEGPAAELMFLEGCDEETMFSKRSPYHWFGESVYAYPANQIDDILHGTDAILMIPDEENERKAYPLAVDLKTNEDDYHARVVNQLDFTIRRQAPEKVYWADTTLDPGASSFDEPSQGRIEALPLAIHIPSRIVKAFRSNATSHVEADRIMRELAPRIRAQAISQLDAYLARLNRNPRDMKPGEKKLYEIASYAFRHIQETQKRTEQKTEQKKSPVSTRRTSVRGL